MTRERERENKEDTARIYRLRNWENYRLYDGASSETNTGVPPSYVRRGQLSVTAQGAPGKEENGGKKEKTVRMEGELKKKALSSRIPL